MPANNATTTKKLITKTAKAMVKQHGIKHGHALDRIAAQLGYNNWNVLSRKIKDGTFTLTNL